MTQFAARPAWVIVPLVVLAVFLGACSASPPKAGAFSASESPGASGSSGSGAPPAAGTAAGAGATAAAKRPASSGTSTAKQAAHAGTTTTVHGAPASGSAPGPGSTSGDATVAPDGAPAGDSSDGSDPSVTIGGFTSTSGGATPTPAPTCDPTVQPVQAVGITDVRTARVDATGALHFTNSFSSATDRKIMAVLGLDEKVAVKGTIITFVRILGCTYTPSQTYTLTKPLTHFEVQFDATAGKPFAPGHYRLRFYVNNKAGWDVAYDVR